jgi:LPXTG-motif cell wall-anchored protein
LYENEIYDLDLKNTSLVILSACETASGGLLEGEGVMSLSRSFSYAGCSNVITTLWNADDRSTAYLTLKLHQYLDKGLTKDAALQQAKLDLLKDPRLNPREKHPYYWSHLILIGNYEAGKDKNWPWIVLLGLAAAGFVGYLIRKKFLTRI